MGYIRRKVLHLAFKIFDLLVVVLSLAAAGLVSLSLKKGGVVPVTDILALRISVENVLLLLCFLLVWHSIFNVLGLYRSKRLSPRSTEIVGILEATSLGTAVFFGAASLFKLQLASPLFAGLFWASCNTLSLLGRAVMRYVLVQMRLRGRNLRFMLIVGTNPRVLRFAKNIEARKEHGYRILGFVDEDWPENPEPDELARRVVADFDGFAAYVRDHVVDEVVLGLPMKAFYHQISRIVRICQEQGIMVRILPHVFGLSRSTVQQIEGGYLVHSGRMEGWPVAVKRVLDIVLSLIILLFLAPLFVAVGLGIKATSPGPVFFRQERVGINKRRFRMFKFRSMFQDAERRLAELEHLNEVSGPVFKIKNDPRITPLGKLLRKTSIDELPQLFNVLMGDMSLVGPRPLPVRDYNGFDKDWYRRRFSVRPGMTCLWQVNGRNGIPFEQWMKLDMEYIDHWSLWLDFKILLRTLPAVLKTPNGL